MGLRDRNANYLVEHIDLLRIAMRKTHQKRPYTTVAMVVLPEHLHAIWKLPEDDANYSSRWRLIKSYFTQSLSNRGISIFKNNRGQYDLWQRRYWEHTIKDEVDLEAHVNYIHYNPVKHGLVQRPIDWPYSSFHLYVRKNILDQNWGETLHFSQIGFGE